MNVTYLFESEEIGLFAVSAETEEKAWETAFEVSGEDDEETLELINSISDDASDYDDILDTWGVDVY